MWVLTDLLLEHHGCHLFKANNGEKGGNVPDFVNVFFPFFILQPTHLYLDLHVEVWNSEHKIHMSCGPEITQYPCCTLINSPQSLRHNYGNVPDACKRDTYTSINCKKNQIHLVKMNSIPITPNIVQIKSRKSKTNVIFK